VINAFGFAFKTGCDIRALFASLPKGLPDAASWALMKHPHEVKVEALADLGVQVGGPSGLALSWLASMSPDFSFFLRSPSWRSPLLGKCPLLASFGCSGRMEKGMPSAVRRRLIIP
jgi:hypothetical protein